MRLLFPEDLPEVSSFDELCRSDAPAIWPCIEPYDFPRLPIQILGRGETTMGNPDERFMRDTYYQGNGWAVIRIKDAIIRDEYICTKDGDVLAIIPWWRLGVRVSYFERGDGKEIEARIGKYLADRPDLPLRTIEKPCTLFFQESHGHWLFEGFLPLAVWQKIGFMPHFLSLDLCPGYRKQFLDLLDVPGKNRLFLSRQDNDFACKELLMAFPWRNKRSKMLSLPDGWTEDGKRCYYQEGAFWHGANDVVREFFCSVGAKTNPKLALGERIFIARESAGSHRQCLNEADAQKIAEKYGFTYVNPAKLSAEQEAATFYNAKIICGGVGGGIHNAIFCKPDTHVICFVGEDDVTWPLPNIATTNKLKLTIIRATTFASIDKMYNGMLSPYVLDLMMFEELLASL